MLPSRYEQGLAKLREIDGEAGVRVVDSLRDIAPDFARYLIEFSFCDIYSRPHEPPLTAPFVATPGDRSALHQQPRSFDRRCR
jgi:hypothetical protein